MKSSLGLCQCLPILKNETSNYDFEIVRRLISTEHSETKEPHPKKKKTRETSAVKEIQGLTNQNTKSQEKRKTAEKSYFEKS